MKVPIIHIDNFWEAPLYAAKINCAINAGKIQATPWKKLSMEDDSIPGYPLACQVHDDELREISRVRNRLLEHIGEQNTLDAWKKTMGKHGQNLTSIVSWFAIDELFLEKHCEEALRIKMRSSVLASLSYGPSASSVDNSVEATRSF